MLSKFEYSKQFLENDKILICPICKKKLYFKEHSLVCENTHNFNISKILEQLGGGGDDYNGAARFEKTTISKVEQELKKAIAKEEGE